MNWEGYVRMWLWPILLFCLIYSLEEHNKEPQFKYLASGQKIEFGTSLIRRSVIREYLTDSVNKLTSWFVTYFVSHQSVSR
jgi:hypothetical protein